MGLIDTKVSLDGKFPSTIMEVSKPKGEERGESTRLTMKPIKLMEHLIRLLIIILNRVMHLIEYDNYQIKPSEEALLIGPIRKLYNNDKSKGKNKFLQMMSIIYFYADPRSSYNYITDDEERLKEILIQEGRPKDFKIDKTL